MAVCVTAPPTRTTAVSWSPATTTSKHDESGRNGTRGLASGVNGGGGKVGDWMGEKANYSGELIQLGTRK